MGKTESHGELQTPITQQSEIQRSIHTEQLWSGMQTTNFPQFPAHPWQPD